MNQRFAFLLPIAFLSIFIISCNKEEGFGGKATIRGVVKERVYNTEFSVLQTEKVALDEDVYIEFGDNQTISDDVKTSANGTFEFNYLLPGTYRIYIYSEDSLNHNTSKIPVITEVKISKDDKTIDLGEIIKYKTIDFDEGTSMVKGIIGVVYYTKNYVYVADFGHAVDHDVYLIYNNRPYSDTRTRTLFDGTYSFTNLIKGKYTIYTYTETVNSGINKEITQNFEITTDNQVVSIDSITINQEL